jgi:signal transduction histidine kinase
MHQQDLSIKAVIDAEDNERKRMASHLHDGVGQLLAATNLNLQVLEEFKNEEDKFDQLMTKTQDILHDAMEEVRSLSHQIMPNMLIKNSLTIALKELIDKTTSPKLQIELALEGLNDKLDEAIQIVMFRVIQECINNTIKHADASKISIHITQNSDKIITRIEDNGKGFNVNQQKQKYSDGIGLENMKSRIESLKGTYQLLSTIGKGTSVRIQIPIKNEKEN